MSKNDNKILCYHCGDNCLSESIKIDDKYFCCQGCKTVYEILNQNNLCDFYNLEESSGIKPSKPIKKNKYGFLEDKDIEKKLIEFEDTNYRITTLTIPVIHCSSCIWLLENLNKINPEILQSKVNFQKKQVNIRYDHNKTNLKTIVELLDSIGYEPQLNLNAIEDKANQNNNKVLFELGVAGFCFGNIMLLSFPEYLNVSDADFETYKYIFIFFNFLLSLPVLLYSASEYYISAYKGLKAKHINIDVPITLGILAMFIRSCYEIFTGTGAGYFDSLAGLVFFLLIGKYLQSKSYQYLTFDRNYKSYFPLSITIKKNNQEESIPVTKLEVGNRIIIHNDEIIPADSVLMSDEAQIDYGFVTGESVLHFKKNGDLVYAGGKQKGNIIECEVVKLTSQSYLTELWNDVAFKEKKDNLLKNTTDVIVKYFTIIVLMIAAIALVYWSFTDFNRGINAFTAVLIIACPCALAISIPFTFSNLLSVFGKNHFYLKNVDVIENLAKANHIVFDKTGTLTNLNKSQIIYKGEELNENEKDIVFSVVKTSLHPISKKIALLLHNQNTILPTKFEEITGKGLKAEFNEQVVLVGSKEFVSANGQFNLQEYESYSKAYIKIDNIIKGVFLISSSYREAVNETIEKLNDKYKLSLLSGDSDHEQKYLKNIFTEKNNILFNQSPYDKINYLKQLEQESDSTIMIGDGLNDAGALAQSNAGIAITDDITNFSPACDGILDATYLNKLPNFLRMAKLALKTVYVSYILSFLYNIVGLYFAVRGDLSPLIAAVLMPLSSISVVAFSFFNIRILSKKNSLL